MLYDFRHALRALGRSRSTTAVVLLSLALGTGANVAVYGVLDALLLRGPRGIGDMSALVSLYTSDFSGSAYGLSSFPDVESARRAAAFSSVAVYHDGVLQNVRVGRVDRSLRIAMVSDEYFPTLQMEASRGALRTSSDANGGEAVIGAAIADETGAADPVGSTLTIGDRTYIVAGVAPPQFRGLQAGRDSDVWIPMGTPADGRGRRRFSAIGRIAPDASIAGAQRELDRISTELAASTPGTNRGNAIDPSAPRRMTIAPYSFLDPTVRAQTILVGFVIAGASTALLASACLNVVGLLLSSTLARRRELAIKMALGITRERLVQQLLVETLCVSLAGGALGVLFALWTAQIVPSLFMAEQAALLDTHLDVWTFAATVGVACAAGAAFGVGPARLGTAAPPSLALRGDTGGIADGHGGRRLRAFVVTGQIALSTVLLLVTGLLVMSIEGALEGELGATVRQVAALSVELPGRFGDPLRGIRARDRLMEKIPEVRGVVRVAWASTLPLGRGNLGEFQIEGESADVTDTREFDTNVVSVGFFDVLALPLVDGRLFEDGDTARSTPVVVVDELLSQRHFGGKAVGRRMIDGHGTRLTIVGVVRTGRYRTLQQAPQPTVFYPFTQDYLYRGHLLVRTGPDPALVLDDLRAVVMRTSRDSGLLRATTLETHLAESLTLDRLTVTLVLGCGLIALAMSTMGVYGIMSDTVRRRTREIGLMVAIGARAGHVARLVLREAAYPALAGLAIGGAAALAISTIARYAISGMPPFDFSWIAAAGAALAGLIAIAAVVPLRRALRVDPNRVLRTE